MKRLILAGLLALGLTFGAQAQEECVASWTDGAAYFDMAHMPVIELTPAQRQAVQIEYNSREPVTDFVFGHVYTVRLPNGALFVSFVVGDDCVIELGPMPPDELFTIIERHSS